MTSSLMTAGLAGAAWHCSVDSVHAQFIRLYMWRVHRAADWWIQLV